MQIFQNLEIIFAILTIILSFFCGRISLVYARDGVQDVDFFSLILGLISNYIWVVSIVWFWYAGNWIIPIIVILISLFGTNTLVIPGYNIVWRIRNLIRLFSILSAIAMWHSKLLI
tara:strand:- start:277 stop:624 length:348 start_codon:yes stop_codon:yes gene_type:complete